MPYLEMLPYKYAWWGQLSDRSESFREPSYSSENWKGSSENLKATFKDEEGTGIMYNYKESMELCLGLAAEAQF